MDTDALYDAAIAGDADAISKLEMEADKINQDQETILHVESQKGNAERVRFILRQFANKNLLVKLDNLKGTALTWAAYHGHTQVAELLIDAARHLPPSANDDPVTSFHAFLRHADADKDTALHSAVVKGNAAIVKLLVEADPTDTHIQNNQGETPMYIAVEQGLSEIVEIISTTCTDPSLDGPDGSAVVRLKNLDQDKSSGGTLYKIMDKDARLYAAAIAGDSDAIAILGTQALTLYGETILHVESRQGNTEHVRFILRQFASKNLLVKLNILDQTALIVAAKYGHTGVVEVLIDAARHLSPPSPADDNPITSYQAFLRHAGLDSETALHAAVKIGDAEITKMLVEADPSHGHSQNIDRETPIYIAAKKGYNYIVKVICTTCTAPSLDGPDGSTALHAAIKHLDHDIEVINLLIAAARRLPPSHNDSPLIRFQTFLRQRDEELNSALHIAVLQGNLATAKILVEADPSDTHRKNNIGKTPIYIAVEKGYYHIVKMICTTCTAPPNVDGPARDGTALHAFIKNLDQATRKEDRDVFGIIIEAVKCIYYIDPDDVLADYKRLVKLFNETDENGCILLELAVEGNYLDLAEVILAKNPAYHITHHPDLIGLMPLIYKATDKDLNDMVNLLTQTYQREVQNVSPSSPYADMPRLVSAIRSRREDYAISLLNNSSLVTFVDNLGWTVLHHAAYYEFDSIIGDIVEAQKRFGHPFVYKHKKSTPFHVAVQKGYTSTVKLLLRLWPSTAAYEYTIYTAVDKNGQNILHLAALQSKKEMIQYIFEKCPEEYKNELVNWQDNNDMNTPLHLLIWRGCFVPQLLRYKGVDIRVQNEKRWTPPDMLYFEDQVINDQVQIRIALDHIQIDQERDIQVQCSQVKEREKMGCFTQKQK